MCEHVGDECGYGVVDELHFSSDAVAVVADVLVFSAAGLS